jgi:homoserine dehydrogenase
LKDLKPVKIGLLGFGTVGQGTATVLARNAAEISRRTGCELIATRALVRNTDRQLPDELSHVALTTDPDSILDDPEISVVVEAMGGDEPAREWLLRAAKAGKHVVTANKALIAQYGDEIFAAARSSGVDVAYEAAVAGGIPVIKAIREGLSGNQIQWLAGIINGTSNFILTEMRDKGRDFADVLAEAQALGYAEADPTFDVEGIDAAHKLTILASIAFGVPLNFKAVYTEGISEITREDTAFAGELGYRIKHLGIARKTDAGIELRVHPTLIPERRLIANVDGVMNAVLVQADAVGPTLYYGAGAGAEPTGRLASRRPANQRVPHLAFQADALASTPMLQQSEVETSFYLRITAEDQPGVMADISRILASRQISIEAIIQKEPESGSTRVPVILLTRKIVEGSMDSAIAELEALPTIHDKIMRIRVESLG